VLKARSGSKEDEILLASRHNYNLYDPFLEQNCPKNQWVVVLRQNRSIFHVQETRMKSAWPLTQLMNVGDTLSFQLANPHQQIFVPQFCRKRTLQLSLYQYSGQN
jgi:hypothetical protein